MSIELVYPFTTPANYTFDSDVIEVTGGKAKLKDQRPAGATFHANYNSDVNGNWGGGVLTGTPIGGAAVSGGKLDLAHDDVRYLDYDADLNADSQQTGCIRFTVTPNYSGTPAATQVFFRIDKANGDTTNEVLIAHKDDGTLLLRIQNSVDASIIDASMGAWSPVSATEYEFEINYDITTGATRLFIDGIQTGSTETGTGTRDDNIGLIRIGANITGTTTSNFLFDNLIIFSTVQHTEDYTPGQSIAATIYATDNPELVCNATFRHEGLDAFVETKSVAGSDQIKYILKKGTVKYYWTGSAWGVSDGTYGQSNTAAGIETNKATFTDTAVTTEVIVLIHSDDGSTTPELDQLGIDYDFSGSSPDSIDTCIVWGYQIQSDADPDVETIKIHLVNDAVKYKTNITITREDYTVTPDANGYWEIELAETENMDGTQRYAFAIGDELFEREVPNEISANFYELN